MGQQLGYKTLELLAGVKHDDIKKTLPLVLNLALTGWSCARTHFRCYLLVVGWRSPPP